LCGGCKSITLTDYTDVTIANMNHNVSLNANWIQENCPGAPLPEVAHLDWEEIGCSKSIAGCSSLSSGDLLLAADVVYDVSVIPHLVKVVKLFLLSAAGKLALFATTFRNEKTFTLFITCLEKEGVQYQEVRGREGGRMGSGSGRG
jgi:predicted nicotinamide N-methyase